MSSLIIPQLKKFIKLHFPDIVILSETKNKKVVLERVRKRIQFDHILIQVVEAVGTAGGMATFWRTTSNIHDVITTTFTIEVKIRDPHENTKWWYIRVYASTVANIRQ